MASVLWTDFQEKHITKRHGVTAQEFDEAWHDRDAPRAGRHPKWGAYYEGYGYTNAGKSLYTRLALAGGQRRCCGVANNGLRGRIMIVRQPDPRTSKQRQRDEEVQRAIEKGTFSRLSVQARQDSRRRASVRKESRRRAAALGVALSEIRRGLGLTQAQVAVRLGTKRPDISRLESGRYAGLTTDRLIALLITLQEASSVPLQSLLVRLAGPFRFASVEATIAGGKP